MQKWGTDSQPIIFIQSVDEINAKQKLLQELNEQIPLLDNKVKDLLKQKEMLEADNEETLSYKMSIINSEYDRAKKLSAEAVNSYNLSQIEIEKLKQSKSELDSLRNEFNSEQYDFKKMVVEKNSQISSMAKALDDREYRLNELSNNLSKKKEELDMREVEVQLKELTADKVSSDNEKSFEDIKLKLAEISNSKSLIKNEYENIASIKERLSIVELQMKDSIDKYNCALSELKFKEFELNKRTEDLNNRFRDIKLSELENVSKFNSLRVKEKEIDEKMSKLNILQKLIDEKIQS